MAANLQISFWTDSFAWNYLLSYHNVIVSISLVSSRFKSLQWRHNGRDSVSNHQPHDCLLNRLFRRRSKKTSKLRVTGLCVGNSPGTGEFPAQMASNAENVSIWWRHHDNFALNTALCFSMKLISFGNNSNTHWKAPRYPIILHHNDVIKWKHLPRNWPFLRGIRRSPVNSPHKGQWRGALMFSLICAWINGWVNNGELGRHCAH